MSDDKKATKVGTIVKQLTEDGLLIYKVLPNKCIQIIQFLGVMENKGKSNERRHNE